MPASIVPARRFTGCDSNRRDARIVEFDADEGQARVTGRGRDRTTEYSFTGGIEVLDPSAGLVRSTAIWLVNISEDHAEAINGRGRNSVATGKEERSLGDIASRRSKQPRRAEGGEDGRVGRIVEEHRQACWSGLGQSLTRGSELGAAGIQEYSERRDRGSRVHDGGVTTIPVDFAATARERSRVVAVVGIPESSAIGIDGALNRGRVWSRGLKHRRRRELRRRVPLRRRALADREQREEQPEGCHE